MRYLLLFYIALSCVCSPGADAVVVTRDAVMENKRELALEHLVDNLWEHFAHFLNQVNAPKCSAGTYFNSTTKRCEDCPTGHYSKADQTSCTPCAEGYYNPKRGLGFCMPCSVGTFASGRGNVKCTGCRAGYISDEIASADCTACTPGTYSDLDHFDCRGCKAGTYSDAPSDVCTPCPSGTVSNTGASECAMCGPITQPNPLREQCVAVTCVPGEKWHGGSCVPCHPGSFSSKFNATTCANCTAGRYNSLSNQTSCARCPRGTFTNSTGSVECHPCSAGHHAHKPGSVRCTACVPGTFSNVSGSVTCSKCDPGSSTDSGAGSISCSKCHPGQFVNKAGSRKCYLCAAGSYAAGSGNINCTHCEAGSYQDKEGQRECGLCAKGSYQNQTGGVSCTECRHKQTYTTYSTGSKSADDCQGPLLRYVINNKTYELTDAGSITAGEIVSLELFAVSGDWAMRDPEQPYKEFHVLKQGSKSIMTGVLIKILVDPMITNVFCYKDTEAHGQYFVGYQRQDRHGRKCETACRNAKGLEIGPYCQVNGEASPCGIPKCIWDVMCSAGDGTGYRGLVSYSRNEGEELVPCQAWNKDYPHAHVKFHPNSYNIATYGLGPHNYCRNPDPGNTHSPWCYTIDFWVRWKYCPLAKCDASFPYFEQ